MRNTRTKGSQSCHDQITRAYSELSGVLHGSTESMSDKINVHSQRFWSTVAVDSSLTLPRPSLEDAAAEGESHMSSGQIRAVVDVNVFA